MLSLRDSLTGMCGAPSILCGDGSVGGFVDDLAAENGHLALHVFDVACGNGIYITIPDGDIRLLAGLDGADLVFQKQLVRGPHGVGTQGGVNVHGLGCSKGMRAIRTLERFARDGGPYSVTRGKRR